jgi:transcriptional regulator with XRE-family HTH domain
MSFGAFIRERRVSKGLTLFDVAAEAEVSVPYLSRIERERENVPKDDLIRRIAVILDIPEDDAFAAARRLPPDLRGEAKEVFAVYRRLSR